MLGGARSCGLPSSALSLQRHHSTSHRKEARGSKTYARIPPRIPRSHHGSSTPISNEHLSNSNLVIRRACGTAEYRAAAYLRAQSFYGESYPEGRSEFARRAHIRMKGDQMWRQIEELCENTEDEQGVIVVPLIAVASVSDFPCIADGLEDLSVALPSANDPKYVVGTLDINIGYKLPSEELIGRQPTDASAAKSQRGYLSNVCVLSTCRRHGIASYLINSSYDVASSLAVRHMYVHVVADNQSARSLYEQRCGFLVEQEEEENFARALNRPRRLLLHKTI